MSETVESGTFNINWEIRVTNPGDPEDTMYDWITDDNESISWFDSEAEAKEDLFRVFRQF